jgi:hypothetical protein
MKGAQALERLAGGSEGNVTANNIHNVVGFLDLFDQGYPIVWQGLTGGKGPSK